ncbi:VanZ family protein [Aminipila sp.]|jgi:glycopeptide antibiotics resistance protein|uniref:VanZ family protein n=1 Tax=Aminipila sp. TaxID=2060095 RepID=UPI0028A0EE5B|nr:VanZ family protein [Aminipila sp.]
MRIKEQNQKKYLFHNVVLYLVFAFYLLILFLLLFHKANSFRSVNLIPLFSITRYLSNDVLLHAFALSNILGNIVLFLPLGVYLTLFNRNKNIVINTFLIVVISIMVEIIQYIFKVGATDIDDVILNGIGGLIGIIIYKILELIFKGKTRRAIEIIAPVGGVMAFAALVIINM